MLGSIIFGPKINILQILILKGLIDSFIAFKAKQDYEPDSIAITNESKSSENM